LRAARGSAARAQRRAPDQSGAGECLNPATALKFKLTIPLRRRAGVQGLQPIMRPVDFASARRCIGDAQIKMPALVIPLINLDRTESIEDVYA
jgi:hypothetical protein